MPLLGGSLSVISVSHSSTSQFQSLSSTSTILNQPYSSTPTHYHTTSFCGVSLQEKRELQELNERFRDSIFNAAEADGTKVLEHELKVLKNNWGKETENIQKIYTEKLESLRLQLKASKTETSDLVAKYYDYDRKFADLERETCFCYFFSVERGFDASFSKDASVKTSELLKKPILCERLQDELRLLYQVWERNKKEWAILADIDSAVRNGEFWITYVYVRVCNIQEEYEKLISGYKEENESCLHLQLKEFMINISRNTTNVLT
ncbi:70 kDa neurofilament protein [Biomphalaria pfeifferi]|uniref:70 kDa neurofilament protein n=1 Tax=Biomphalaria pfeifferi TaxID=112525 RepID=A0AAD8F9W1_BIOPF|nr:70 kDa neurofilament protein [Biomphalaria pfeifferi]